MCTVPPGEGRAPHCLSGGKPGALSQSVVPLRGVCLFTMRAGSVHCSGDGHIR